MEKCVLFCIGPPSNFNIIISTYFKHTVTDTTQKCMMVLPALSHILAFLLWFVIYVVQVFCSLLKLVSFMLVSIGEMLNQLSLTSFVLAILISGCPNVSASTSQGPLHYMN